MDAAIKASLVEEFVPYQNKLERFENLTIEDVVACRALLREWRTHVSPIGYEIIEKACNDPSSVSASTIYEKRCYRCALVKPFTEFYPSDSNADKLSVKCRKCILEEKAIKRKARKMGFAVGPGR